MSVRRLVCCDIPGCASQFVGSPAEEYAAGWRRIDHPKSRERGHRCPTCRAKIGTRPGRQRKPPKGTLPELPIRAAMRYGSAAYGRESMSEAEVRERLMALRGGRT